MSPDETDPDVVPAEAEMETVGVGVGFAEVLDVTAGESARGSSSDAPDEVEA